MVGERASPRIDRLPSARGPNSIRPGTNPPLINVKGVLDLVSRPGGVDLRR